MATYLVRRRMDLGGVIPVDALVIDPPDVQLLIDRNYITPVADDHAGDRYDGEGQLISTSEQATEPEPVPTTGSGAQDPSSASGVLPHVIDLSSVKEEPVAEDRAPGDVTEPDGSPVVDETGPNGPEIVPQDGSVTVNENDQAINKDTGNLDKDDENAENKTGK